MGIDHDQENNHKTSQRIWSTRLLFQMDTISRTPEQQNISCVQWKLRGDNRIPKGVAP